MAQEESQIDPDSECKETATYERWKHQSYIPFRFSFFGLLVVAFVGLDAARDTWHTAYWPLGALLGLMFVAGALRLFYDIPQRRLSRMSKAFLGLGVAVSFAIMIFGILRRWGVV